MVVRYVASPRKPYSDHPRGTRGDGIGFISITDVNNFRGANAKLATSPMENLGAGLCVAAICRHENVREA